MKKSTTIIYSFLLVVTILMIVLIEAISIACPGDNLMPSNSLVFTFVFTIFILFIFKLWDKFLYKTFSKISWLYWFFCFSFAIFLYILGVNYGNRWEGIIQADYSQIYLAAKEIACNQPLSQESYFYVYSNNLKPAYLLALLIKTAHVLGIRNEFYFLLGISVSSVLISIILTGKLVGKKYRVIVFLLYALFLPLYVFTFYFYTDTLSFCIGIVCIYLLEKMKSSHVPCFVGTLAGIIISLGIILKITSIIPLIAYLLVCVANLSIKNKLKAGPIISLLIPICIVLLISNLYVSSTTIGKKANEKGNPVISWIALGLSNDGTWSGNYDFVNELNQLETKSEKECFSWNYIKKNISSLWDLNHIVAKLRTNYATGNMSAGVMLRVSEEDTLQWKMFNPWGSYYWRTSEYNFSFMMSIYAVILIGCIKCLFLLKSGFDINPLLPTSALSLIGITVFLMLWEANSRQLYNQIPTLFLFFALCLGILSREQSVK